MVPPDARPAIGVLECQDCGDARPARLTGNPRVSRCHLCGGDVSWDGVDDGDDG
jgi:hypothetical protein